MKRIKKVLLITALVISSNVVNSQTIDSLYEVGTWEDFRVSAITYSFDDNLAYQYSKAIPALDEVGYKATFNSISTSAIGVTPSWTTLKKIAGNGHEIASHTINHTNLSTLNDSLQTLQLKNSQETINANVDNQKCLTIAYPFCVPGNNAITSKYYISGRHCQGFVEGKTPTDFMSVSSVICGSTGVKTIQEFKAKINEAVTKKGWCVFLIHELDNGSGYSPLSSSVFKSSLYYCKVRNYKVWVSSFVNISKYIKERNAASVKEVSANDSVITVQVTDTLDNALYDYPISIRRQLPANWKAVNVTQNDKVLNTMYVKKDTITYVMFNVVPDSGEVKLKSADNEIDLIDQSYEDADTVGIAQVSIPGIFKGNSNKSLKLNYASGNLRFELPSGSGNDVTLSVYNTMGVLLATYKVTNLTNGIGNVQLSENIIKSKNCIVKASDGKASWSQAMILL